MDTSGRTFLNYVAWLGRSGRVKQNTAASLRVAATRILACSEGWEDQDVMSVDAEKLFGAFEDRWRSRYAPGTIDVYKSRFRTALESFREFAARPANAAALERLARRNTKHPSVTVAPRMRPTQPGQAAEQPEATIDLVDYAYPLRADQMVRLRLPVDLTLAEARRLSAFITTLATDFSPERSS